MANAIVKKIKLGNTTYDIKDDSGTKSTHTHTKDQITDFPTIPTVNNASLDLCANGNSETTFLANDAQNRVFNIGTGSADGTIMVGGGEVSVKGLKSAAFTESSAYATASHSHSISDVTNLQTTLNAKAPTASPTFTGTVTMPFSSAGFVKTSASGVLSVDTNSYSLTGHTHSAIDITISDVGSYTNVKQAIGDLNSRLTAVETALDGLLTRLSAI